MQTQNQNIDAQENSNSSALKDNQRTGRSGIFATLTNIMRMTDPRWNRDGPNLDDQLEKLFKSFFKKSGGSSGNGSGVSPLNQIPKKMFYYIGLGIVALYIIGGFYTVDEKEQAIILRLGNYSSTAAPGLHWRFLLLDKKFQENVTQQRTFKIERTMLTEDQNIIEVPVSVQYKINDFKSFALKVEDPILSLEAATQAAMRYVVGTSKMDNVLSIGREEIAAKVHQRLQYRLDLYETGLFVTKVNILKGNPPSQVQAAFVDVIKAQEDKERMKNEAEAYSNKLIPETRGQVKRILEEAEAYKQEVIAKSQGDANRFILLWTEYKKAPVVTRQRLYLETIETLYQNTSKILIDAQDSNNVLMLPMGSSSGFISDGTNNNGVNDMEINRIAQQLVTPILQELKNSTGKKLKRSR